MGLGEFGAVAEVDLVEGDRGRRRAGLGRRGWGGAGSAWPLPSTMMVTTSSSGSSHAITVMASSMRVLVAAEIRDPVVTSRSRVVSAVTRAIRSPGSLRSTAEMRRRGGGTVEVRPEVVERFNAAIDRRMTDTVWSTGCKSWYLDDTGRNGTLWPDWTFMFRRRAERFDPAEYEIAQPQPSRVAVV